MLSSKPVELKYAWKTELFVYALVCTLRFEILPSNKRLNFDCYLCYISEPESVIYQLNLACLAYHVN